jgi:hypothetical protein
MKIGTRIETKIKTKIGTRMGTRMGARMMCSRGREAVGGFARFGVLFMVLFIIAAHRDGSPYRGLDERCGEVGRGVPAEPGWWGMLNGS